MKHAALLILSTVVALTACSRERILGPKDDLDLNSLRIEFSIDRGSYQSEQTIGFRISLGNIGLSDTTVTFPDTQIYDFEIRDPDGNEVWRWSYGKLFAQVLCPRTLKPGDFLRYQDRFTGTLVPGGYIAAGWFAFDPETEITLGFTVIP